MFDLMAFIIGMMMLTIFILSILIFIIRFISKENEVVITTLAMLICLLLFLASFIVGTLLGVASR